MGVGRVSAVGRGVMQHRARGYKHRLGLDPGIWQDACFGGSMPFTLPLPRSVTSPHLEARKGREVRRR